MWQLEKEQHSPFSLSLTLSLSASFMQRLKDFRLSWKLSAKCVEASRDKRANKKCLC